MLEIIGNNLTLAIASSVSPVSLIVLLVLLSTEKAKRLGFIFLFGLFASSFLLLFIAVNAQSVITGNDQATAATGINYTSLILSFLFFFLGYNQFKGRPLPGEKAELPNWMKGLSKMNPIKLFLTAAVVNAIVIKNIPAYILVGQHLVKSNLPDNQQIITMIIITCLFIFAPLMVMLISLFGGENSAAALKRGKDWLVKNNSIIMMIIFFMLGLKLLGAAIAGLF